MSAPPITLEEVCAAWVEQGLGSVCFTVPGGRMVYFCLGRRAGGAFDSGAKGRRICGFDTLELLAGECEWLARILKVDGAILKKRAGAGS